MTYYLIDASKGEIITTGEEPFHAQDCARHHGVPVLVIEGRVIDSAHPLGSMHVKRTTATTLRRH